MTQDRTDRTGDYGYDLAHEDATASPGPPAQPHPGPPPPPAGPDEDAGDHSYDEAHDFRSR
ncbi:hypothetical protein [Geodermatophilus sabuli]|uniref:Uncharacterized protein n=1 Tax=Geodermatophilus sabuli TaxID=1564158 RepID=A0A285EHP5_9ACTN|nr:hypothetical protein [Geodermatophilus sabuli]MBB3083879.1 hypothetical protein [Geodermatophilus sabuli]SNX98530.1 hypothetical protein SAMN06893097_11144 [Geodermatophilus sabuli]